MTNPDEGVLSPRFRKAFFPDLKEELKYNGLNKKLYRELSEYVHGHASTWAGADDIKYDEKLHKAWLEKLETYMTVTSVLLSLRYIQEVGDDAVIKLAPKLRARVGHVTAIATYLDERVPAPPPATATAEATGATPAVAPAPAEVAVATEPAVAETEASGTSAAQESNGAAGGNDDASH